MYVVKISAVILLCILIFSCNSTEEIETTAAEETTAKIVEIDGIKITDMNDIGKLELPEDFEGHINLINAFINNNTDMLEDRAFLKRGMYTEYKTLTVGNYEIIRDYDEEHHLIILYFNFEIIESGMDTLPVGKYQTQVNDGPNGTTMIFLSDTNENKISSPVTDAIYNWFATCVNYMITPDLIAEMSDGMRADISETILQILPLDEKGHPLEDLQACALKYYGISDFMPAPPVSDYYDKGLYVIGGHGGEIWVYDITGADHNSVTVQFYSDYSATVKSRLIKYFIEEIDGHFVIKDCQIIEESQYAPYHRSV
jgi:hypothetical protein